MGAETDPDGSVGAGGTVPATDPPAVDPGR